MAYTPTVWATGDVITAEKLNKAEEGIAANSNLVYLAIAEVPQGTDSPVITEGDFDDACSIIEAGGIVVIKFTVEGVGTFQYYSAQYFSGESAAIDLFSVTAHGASLNMQGLEWKTGRLSPWPIT